MSRLARCRVSDIGIIPGIQHQIVRDIDFVEVLRGYVIYSPE